VNVELELAESLREIAEADDDIDRALASKAMDVGQIVEDEVILALPTAPRHDSCRMAGATARAGESPFGKLAVLKGGKNP